MQRRSNATPRKFRMKIRQIVYLQCFIIISLLLYIVTLTVVVTNVEKKIENKEPKSPFLDKIPFSSFDEDDGIKQTNDDLSIATTEKPVDSNDTKQTLILHVGPPKTGTTSIQDALKTLSRRIYNEDSYIVMYKVFRDAEAYSRMKLLEKHFTSGYPFSFLSLESDLGHLNSTAKKKNHLGAKSYWDYVASNFLDTARRKKKNVILSAEELCFDRFPDNDFTWNMVLPELRKWNVQIVVTYRRYFEWLTSWYFRMVSNRFRLTEFAKPNFFQNEYVSFQTFFNNALSDAQKLTHDGLWMDVHPTQHAIRKFGRHFHNIKQFNLHLSENQNEVVRDFVCDIITYPTNTTCQALTEMNYVSRKKNEGASANFGLLVHAFHNQGLITDADFESIFRHNDFLRHKYQEVMKNAFPSLEVPYKCLSNIQLHKLLNMSLSYEEYLQPKWFQSNGVKEDHEQQFWKAVESKKFCDLDFDEIFRNKREGDKYYPLFHLIQNLRAKAVYLNEDPYEEELFSKQNKRFNKRSIFRHKFDHKFRDIKHYKRKKKTPKIERFRESDRSWKKKKKILNNSVL